MLRKKSSVSAQELQHEEDMKKWEAFMAQYTKLSRALHRSSDTEMMLVNKCREMKVGRPICAAL